MTPRDALRCAGWALRLATWASMRAMGARVGVASHATGVHPVEGAWRRHSPTGLTFGEDGPYGAFRAVDVREWVVAGETTFAVGDGCVWVLATAKEGR